MATPESQADSPASTVDSPIKLAPSRTIRIHVNLKEKAPGTVISYAELLRKAVQPSKDDSSMDADAPPDSDIHAEKPPEPSKEDSFFQSLLARSAKYTLEEDDEDSSGPANRKKLPDNEYDVDDPFIDDSDMLLDDSYAYSSKKHDGFFVYHGPLEDEEEKKKASKKAAESRVTSKKLTVKKKGLADPSDQSHSETEGDGKTKSVKKSVTKKPVVKGTATSTQAKKRKPDAGEGSAKDDSQKKKKSKLEDPTASPSKKPDLAKKKPSAASDGVKNEDTVMTNGDAADKSAQAQDSEKDGGPTSHVASAGANASTTDAPQASPTPEPKMKKANKPVKLFPLDPQVEKIMQQLKEDAGKEDFAVKSKFPPNLRPTVLAAGSIVFRQQNCAEENFVNHLMAILPYNRFTLRKFLLKQLAPVRIEELQTEIDNMIPLLKQQVDEAMPVQLKQHAEQVAKAKEAKDGETQKGGTAEGEETNNDEKKEDNKDGGANAEGDQAATKFRFNEETRKTLYNIMQAEGARTNLKNDLSKILNSSQDQISETTARKQMYQRLMPCFPDGWMTTYDMSRQYSQYKVRLQKKEDKTAAATPH
ncbi:hypothetical protein INT43_008872 [Umbelopsis isabellina]|uniref:Ubinuclein middle domain-containing protein n=1 Tax=Mortierella isabellina TaxID=91625 RepID=A0A8H7PVD7_MORIS|nr:hypothetical protein INT43_008872 [Umbelopsis isabellina]